MTTPHDAPPGFRTLQSIQGAGTTDLSWIWHANMHCIVGAQTRQQAEHARHDRHHYFDDGKEFANHDFAGYGIYSWTVIRALC